MELPYPLAKLMYPMPDEGDFVDKMELGKMVSDDGDDNVAANKEPDKKGKKNG